MIKKLTKGIEDGTREKERLEGEKEKLLTVFKSIEQKAFAIQETYKETQKVLTLLIFFYLHIIWIRVIEQSFLFFVVQLIDEHKDVLTEAKSNYEKLKKSVDELKASRVTNNRILFFLAGCSCVSHLGCFSSFNT